MLKWCHERWVTIITSSIPSDNVQMSLWTKAPCLFLEKFNTIQILLINVPICWCWDLSPEVELHATLQGKKVAYSIIAPAETVSK